MSWNLEHSLLCVFLLTILFYTIYIYSKTYLKQSLSKRPQIVFHDQLSLDAGQKNCRLLQKEHSAILSTFIKLPLSLRSLFCLFFEWPFYTGFTVHG